MVSSKTVNSFKNSLDKHWEENLLDVRVNWQRPSLANDEQTVLGQCFAEYEANCLSYTTTIIFSSLLVYCVKKVAIGLIVSSIYLFHSRSTIGQVRANETSSEAKQEFSVRNMDALMNAQYPHKW